MRRNTPGPHLDLSSCDIRNDHRADDVAQASLSAIQTTALLLNRFRAEMRRRINEAIERWRYGKYGKCLDCNRRITTPRLSALPEAERCLLCQRLEENGNP